MTVYDLREQAAKVLAFKDYSIVDIVCASYVSAKILPRPLWILLVGPPASGKTAILNILYDMSEGIYKLGKLTENTLVSGLRSSKKKGRADASLVYQIEDRLAIMKDFTTPMKLRPDRRAEVFSQLREIYDGEFSANWGTNEKLNWEGRVGFIGGVTEYIFQHYHTIQELGDRFLYCRMPEDDWERGCSLADDIFETAERRKILRKNTARFLRSLDYGIRATLTPEYRQKVMAIAKYTTLARTHTIANIEEAHFEDANPEHVERVYEQLRCFLACLAVVHKSSTINEDAYNIVKKIGLDSVPSIRAKILSYLWSNYPNEVTTADVRDLISRTNATTRSILRGLKHLKLVTFGENTNKWLLSEFAAGLLEEVHGA